MCWKLSPISVVTWVANRFSRNDGTSLSHHDWKLNRENLCSTVHFNIQLTIKTWQKHHLQIAIISCASSLLLIWSFSGWSYILSSPEFFFYRLFLHNYLKQLSRVMKTWMLSRSLDQRARGFGCLGLILFSLPISCF